MTAVAHFELVLVLIGAALVLSLLAGRLRLPPAVALVLGGIVLAVVPSVPAFDLEPDLIMVLFLPPLLQASAFFTVWRDFRADLRPILILAVGLVLFTTLFVGLVAHMAVPSLPWAACFALGAIVSPPDAVAAKAVLQGLHLPPRLTTILEGESLVNDATGLVLYRFAVAAALSGTFSLWKASASFVWLAVGGIVIGLACGYATNLVIRRLKDGRTTIVLSFLVSWATYMLAEEVGASGVLAVVSAGILLGIYGHEAFGAKTRIEAIAVWDVVVFVLEAFVFVLIGLSLRGVLHRLGGDVHGILEAMPMALAVTGAVVASRLIWVFPATYLPRWLSPKLRERDPPPPAKIPLIIGWAGMRGVVTLAVALALPIEFPGRDLILFTSFVVILFTVIVQGLTLGPLIRALKLEPPAPRPSDLLDIVAARIAINEAAVASLEAIVHPETAEPLHPKLTEEYARRVRALSRLRDDRETMEITRRDHFTAALGAVAIARAELIRLHRTRKIHDTVLRSIESDLDLEEVRLKRLGGFVTE